MVEERATETGARRNTELLNSRADSRRLQTVATAEQVCRLARGTALAHCLAGAWFPSEVQEHLAG